MSQSTVYDHGQAKTQTHNGFVRMQCARAATHKIPWKFSQLILQYFWFSSVRCKHHAVAKLARRDRHTIKRFIFFFVCNFFFHFVSCAKFGATIRENWFNLEHENSLIIISRFAHDAIYSVFPEIPVLCSKCVQIENYIATVLWLLGRRANCENSCVQTKRFRRYLSSKHRFFWEIPDFRLHCFNRRPFMIEKRGVGSTKMRRQFVAIDCGLSSMNAGLHVRHRPTKKDFRALETFAPNEWLH